MTGARMFAGRSGAYLVLNGDQFYRNSGQVLYSVDYGKTFYALKYYPLTGASGGLRFSRIQPAWVVKANLHTIDVHHDGYKATLELDAKQIIFRGETFVEIGNRFDPSTCRVVPLPLARTETHLWKFSGGYLLKAADSNYWETCFYIGGEQAYATDTRPVSDSSDNHTEDCCNEVHFFDHGTQLVICCQGDVFAGEPLKLLETEKFVFDYSADGKTVTVKRQRPHPATQKRSQIAP